jgi:hypothetical protein
MDNIFCFGLVFTVLALGLAFVLSFVFGLFTKRVDSAHVNGVQSNRDKCAQIYIFVALT